MLKLKVMLARVVHEVGAAEKALPSKVEVIVDGCVVVFAVLVWLGAMTLIP